MAPARPSSLVPPRGTAHPPKTTPLTWANILDRRRAREYIPTGRASPSLSGLRSLRACHHGSSPPGLLAETRSPRQARDLAPAPAAFGRPGLALGPWASCTHPSRSCWRPPSSSVSSSPSPPAPHRSGPGLWAGRTPCFAWVCASPPTPGPAGARHHTSHLHHRNHPMPTWPLAPAAADHPRK